MFGLFKKKEKPAPVGAKEKIRVALEMQQAGGNILKSGQRGKGQDDTLALMIAIWGVACLLALTLMQFSFPKGTPFHLPDPALDDLLLRMPPPSFVSDPDMNTLVSMFVRGTGFFLCAGLVPGIVKLLSLIARRKEKTPTPIWLFWMVLAFFLAGAAVLRNV